MTKRSTATRRDRRYIGRSALGECLPIFRKPVDAGESVTSIQQRIKFKTPVIGRGALNSMHLNYVLAYVPYRLVWPEFVDFITEDPAVATPALPTVSADARLFFTRNGDHALYLRAYKLAYNRLIGDSRYSELGVTGDTFLGVASAPVRHPFLDRAQQTEEIVDPELDTSSGSVSYTDYLEWKARVMNERQASVDDGYEYTDYLKRMGVNAAENIHVDPEIVGWGRTTIDPTQATDPSGSGGKTARYEGSCFLKARKSTFYCPEPGFLIGIVWAQLELMMAEYAIDSAWTEPRDFFNGDQSPRTVDLATAGIVTTTGDETVQVPPIAETSWGQTSVFGEDGANDEILTRAAASFEGTKYGTNTIPVDAADNLNHNMFFLTSSMKCISPRSGKLVRF